MEVTNGRGYVYSIQYHIVWCANASINILNEGLRLLKIA